MANVQLSLRNETIKNTIVSESLAIYTNLDLFAVMLAVLQVSDLNHKPLTGALRIKIIPLRPDSET